MPSSRPNAARRRPLLLLSVVGLVAAGCGVHAGDAAEDRVAPTHGPDTTTTTPRTTTTTRATTRPPTTTLPVRNEADVNLRNAAYGTLQATRYTIKSSMDQVIFDQERHLQLDGSVDLGAHIGDLEIMMRVIGETSTVHVLADGTGLWLEEHYPGFEMPAGKVWFGGSATELDESLVLAPTSLLPLVLVLQGTVGAETGPSKTLDGVTATRFDTTVSYKQVQDALGVPGPTNAELSAFEDLIPQGGRHGPDLEVTVWVGSDDVIRSFQLTIVEQGTGAEPGITGSAEIVLSNVGGLMPPPARPDPSTVEVVDEPIGGQILYG